MRFSFTLWNNKLHKFNIQTDGATLSIPRLKGGDQVIHWLPTMRPRLACDFQLRDRTADAAVRTTSSDDALRMYQGVPRARVAVDWNCCGNTVTTWRRIRCARC